MKETIRDDIAGEITLEYFVKRFAEGWKIANIEWFRETDASDVPVTSTALLNPESAVPYGFQITQTGFVQEDPLEVTVLLLILQQIVKEKRIQEIAIELNLRGYSTRDGKRWSPTDVFNILPRLIEAAPALLKSKEWQQLRSDAESGSKPN